MAPTQRPKERLSSALLNLNGDSILQHLCRYEHQRQISIDWISELEVMRDVASDSLNLETWEAEYLEKVNETVDHAAVLFSSIDLAWRRHILDQATLAPSLDLDRIRSVIDRYFRAPIDPYSIPDYALDQGLDFVVEFGSMYERIAQEWQAKGRSPQWIENVSPSLDTELLVRLTKKYVRGVRQSSARVKAIYDKYISEDFSQGLGENGSGPSRPLLHNSQDGLLTPCASSDDLRGGNDGDDGNDDDDDGDNAGAPSRRRSQNGNGSSVTLAASTRDQDSEKKSGKRKREQRDDGEQDREIFTVKEESPMESTGAREEGKAGTTSREVKRTREAGSPGSNGDEMDVDGPSRCIPPSDTRPMMPSSPSQPLSPVVPSDKDNERRSERPSPSASNKSRKPSARATELAYAELSKAATRTLDGLRGVSMARPIFTDPSPAYPDASQFPQPLTKPTYLSRVSRSPSASSNRERAVSPYAAALQRGLPLGIREMAERNQSKLARVRRSSEVHQEEERDRELSMERSASVEQQASGKYGRRREERSASAEKKDRERERKKTEELEEEEVMKRSLVSTPSGILMPPPPSRSSQPTSSGGEAPAPASSGQEPSTLIEPSTILSSPPQPKSHSAAPKRNTMAVVPGSIDEHEPSTEKSSQDYVFPTAAQFGTSRPNPHFPPTQDSPATSSIPPPPRPAAQDDSQSQDDSQPEATDSNASSQSVPRPLEPIPTHATTTPSSSSVLSALTSSAPVPSSYPKILVPDTSISTTAESYESDSSSGRPTYQSAVSFLSPVKRNPTTRGLSAEPPSKATPLRRSPRLSKSPGPRGAPELASTRQTTAQLFKTKLPLVSSSLSGGEGNESQAFFTQAPIEDDDDDGEIASQADYEAHRYSANVEEEEEVEEEVEDKEDSQESSGLTYLSSAELTKRIQSERGKGNRAVIADVVEADSELFESPEKRGSGRMRKMSFGELESRATGDAPAEEALDLEDDDGPFVAANKK